MEDIIGAEEQPKKKVPFWRNWKFWAWVGGALLFWLWAISPSDSTPKGDLAIKRADFIAKSEEILSENYDGHEISESGNVLTISVWNDNFGLSKVVSMRKLAPTTLTNMQNDYISLCKTMQEAARQNGTRYTIKLQLMDGGNTDSALLVVQNGRCLDKLID